MKLSLVIPIYNERAFVRAFWNTLKKTPLSKSMEVTSVELIVVDDGSTDGTTEVLRELVNQPFNFVCGIVAEIIFLPQEKNRGKGNAVRIGIGHSKGDLVLIQDADLEYSPEDIPSLLAPIIKGDADAVFGSRFTGHCSRAMYFWHAVVNKYLTLLSNMFNDLNLTDLTTGYKAISGQLARSIRLTSNRFGIEPEITARLAKSKARVYEVPISYTGRSYLQGKKIHKRDAVSILFHILRYGLWDTEPFGKGLMQTLFALEKASSHVYVPVLKKAIRLAKIKKQELRILEIGSGTGTLTQILVNYGSVVATDISDDFVKILNRRFLHYDDFQAIQWDAGTILPEHLGQFDLVVAFNVLEHIEKDILALNFWGKVLTKNGALIVLVPNYPRLYSPIDASVAHFRRYTRKDLVGKLHQIGLSPGKILFGNSLGILGWYWNGIILKRSTLSRGQLGLYAFLKPLLWFIEWPLERFSGLSLVAIAKKQVTESI